MAFGGGVEEHVGEPGGKADRSVLKTEDWVPNGPPSQDAVQDAPPVIPSEAKDWPAMSKLPSIIAPGVMAIVVARKTSYVVERGRMISA